MNKNLIKSAFLFALGELIYISLVATFMFFIGKVFGDKPDTAMAPVIFLLLFVLSVAVSGGLILGKPVMLYFDGQKKEAVQLFIFTLSWLLVFLIAALVVMFMLAK